MNAVVLRLSGVAMFLLCRAEHVNTLDLQRRKEGRIGEKVFPQEKQRGSVRINVTALASSRKIILADYVGTPTHAVFQVFS